MLYNAMGDVRGSPTSEEKSALIVRMEKGKSRENESEREIKKEEEFTTEAAEGHGRR